MRGWIVLAVVALQAVAQTTAMALQGGGSGGDRGGGVVSSSPGEENSDTNIDKNSVEKTIDEKSSAQRTVGLEKNSPVLYQEGKGSDPKKLYNSHWDTVVMELRISRWTEDDFSTPKFLEEDEISPKPTKIRVNRDTTSTSHMYSNEDGISKSAKDTIEPIEKIANKETSTVDDGKDEGGHHPPLVKRVARDAGNFLNSLTPEDKTSARVKSTSGVDSSSMEKMKPENHASVEARGLLDSILGGGGRNNIREKEVP